MVAEHTDSGSGPSPTTTRRRNGLWLVPAGLVLVLVVIGSWYLTSNRIYHVVPGEVLRSRLLEEDDLREVIDEYNLRTVISLIGSHSEPLWLKTERSVCSEMGVRHHSTSFSLDEWPARHEVRKLVHFLETSEKPILLHCYQGVDRSGWASAFRLLLDGTPLDDALIHLSPRYGHLCDRDSCPLHLFFDSYENHLSRRALAGGSEVFRVWVVEYYCPEPYNARLDLLSAIPTRVSPKERIRTTVRAINQGSFSWRMTDLKTTGVRLGVRVIGPFEAEPENALDIFRTPDGPAVDVARSGLEFGVMAPASQRDFEIRFSAPTEPGLYVVQIDMVDELVHWFSDLGFPGLIHTIEVIDPNTDDAMPEGVL